MNKLEMSKLSYQEQLDEVKDVGYNLKYIEDQTEEMCLIAVKQNGYNLQFVKEQTPKICWEAVKVMGSSIQYVNNEYLKDDLDEYDTKEPLNNFNDDVQKLYSEDDKTEHIVFINPDMDMLTCIESGDECNTVTIYSDFDNEKIETFIRRMRDNDNTINEVTKLVFTSSDSNIFTRELEKLDGIHITINKFEWGSMFYLKKENCRVEVD